MQNEGSAGVVSLQDLLENNAPITKPESAEEVTKVISDSLKNEEPLLPGFIFEDDNIIDDNKPKVDSKPDPKEDEHKADPILDFETKIENTEIEPESSKIYRNTLKSLWGDEIGSIVQEIDGVEQEVSIDDIEFDEETFKSIFQSKIDEIQEAANKNKISIDDVSEFTKNLIEVENNGGSLKDLLDIKQKFADPLEGLDLENVEDQKTVIFLRNQAAGQSDADINRLIKSYESEGILSEMAEEADASLRTAIDAKVKAEVLKSEQDKKEREELFKKYKTDIKTTLGNVFELNDKAKSKLVDFATKANKEGKYEMDIVYNEMRLNPEKAAELMLFMTDKDEFIKQVTKKAVVEKQLEGARKLKIIRRTDSASSLSAPVNTNKAVRLEDLK
jgi:hypothetical protein